MKPNVAKAAAACVECHFTREDGVSAFLVVVPDDVLTALNEGHPLRGLQIAFGAGSSKSARLRALANAVKAAEDAGAVKQDKPLRWVRRFASWVVTMIYPVARPFIPKGDAK